MKPEELKLGQVLALSRNLELCPDPVRLYDELCGGRSDTLLLESADHTRKTGERSVVITRAALRLCCREREVRAEALSKNGASLLVRLSQRLAGRAEHIEQGGDVLSLRFGGPAGGSERERLLAASVLDAVRAAILGLDVVGQPSLPPLCAGSFAYDLLGLYEALPPARADGLAWPDYELWLAEEALWIQHAARRTSLHRYVFGGEHAEAAYHDATAAMAERIADLGVIGERGYAAAPAPAAAAVEVDMEDADFEGLVLGLRHHIVAGDVFQIVPSRTFSHACPDPLGAYARLRTLNPSPYMFFIRSEHGTLFGASPESALTVRGPRAKRASISPLAGTRKRARRRDGSIDSDLDARLEAELRLDAKEVAEHMMLVDLARNDVARVSRAGTRRVERLLDVVRYSHVMHLESLVSGELAPDLDALHAYVATMNMGTLVGAPKLRAAELLRENERDRRGPYGGAVGYLNSEGDLDTCIVIRSALVQDGVARVRAGCGVVYDSVPAAEAEETRRKAAAVLAALAGPAVRAGPSGEGS